MTRPYLVPTLVAAAALSGCGPAPAPATAATEPSGTRAIAARSSCFLLYEMGQGEVHRGPAQACATRVSPASTFKIPHALAALDAGVVAGADTLFPYDGHTVPFEAWRRDQTLATAMRYSVVWYFQHIATLLGPERERAYLERFDYGNEDSSSGLTTFWLDGSLRISPEEEERFLVRLYDGKLPVKAEAVRTLRQILTQPAGAVVNALGEHPFDAPWPEGTVVEAKTGRGDHEVWLVGHVERAGRAWVFVTSIQGDGLESAAAIDLAAASLRGEGVL